MQGGLILEYYRETVDPLRGRLFSPKLILDNEGQVVVPDAPGLGIEIDFAVLAEHRVA